MPLDTDMYKALNEAWEKQKQIGPTKGLTWGDGFTAGWQAGLKEKGKGDATP